MTPIDDELRRELEGVALAPAPSGRAAWRKSKTLRLLERLDREADGDFPTDDDARFHPCAPQWWELDAHDSDLTRERWHLAWLADRLGS